MKSTWSLGWKTGLYRIDRLIPSRFTVFGLSFVLFTSPTLNETLCIHTGPSSTKSGGMYYSEAPTASTTNMRSWLPVTKKEAAGGIRCDWQANTFPDQQCTFYGGQTAKQATWINKQLIPPCPSTIKKHSIRSKVVWRSLHRNHSHRHSFSNQNQCKFRVIGMLISLVSMGQAINRRWQISPRQRAITRALCFLRFHLTTHKSLPRPA